MYLCLYFFFFIYIYKKYFPSPSAPSAETTVKENGETNVDVKETLDPNIPKKCDVIVISGRKERCDTALEALKVYIKIYIYFFFLNEMYCEITFAVLGFFYEHGGVGVKKGGRICVVVKF